MVWQPAHPFDWKRLMPCAAGLDVAAAVPDVVAATVVVVPPAASAAAATGDTGAPCCPLIHLSKSDGVTATTRRSMLACDVPQYSAHCPKKVPGRSALIFMWFCWPGTTSTLPASSGGQKL